MRRLAPALAALLILSCGQPKQTPGPASSAGATVPSPSSPAVTPGPAKEIYAEMVTVDYEGTPLANMVPIATAEANAFDKPIAQGSLTDDKGFSAFAIPGGRRLFLRAWDPALRMFANNFYEIPASQGGRAGKMTITMVPASSLEVTVVEPNGQPATGKTVRLMLIHPAKGPWWPGEKPADDKGVVKFDPVPPGEYDIMLKVDGVGEATRPKVFLPPNNPLNLGEVALQP